MKEQWEEFNKNFTDADYNTFEAFYHSYDTTLEDVWPIVYAWLERIVEKSCERYDPSSRVLKNFWHRTICVTMGLTKGTDIKYFTDERNFLENVTRQIFFLEQDKPRCLRDAFVLLKYRKSVWLKSSVCRQFVAAHFAEPRFEKGDMVKLLGTNRKFFVTEYPDVVPHRFHHGNKIIKIAATDTFRIQYSPEYSYLKVKA